jgi:hypothetical protein
LRGRVVDYGDLVYREEWLVKGRRFALTWRVGAPRDVDPATRTGTSAAGATHREPDPGEVDVVVDLQADKKVPLSVTWTDELGHPTEPPAGAVVAYTVDDATVIDLTDNGDGTAVAAATGTLGTATVHAEASATGMPTVTGDLQLVVVAGLAERLEIVAGPLEEVTPDEPPPTA